MRGPRAWSKEDPASALAVLSSRLMGLSPEARHALRAASYFGQLFWSGGVGELIGLDPSPFWRNSNRKS